MSESGDKKHPPTPRRLRKAREEGNVAQSATLTAAVGTLVVAFALAWSLPAFAQRCATGTRELFRAASSGTDLQRSMEIASAFFLGVFLDLAPVLGAATLLTAVASFLQVGPLVTIKPLLPALEKLNPVTGLRERIFSMQALVSLCRNGVTVLLLSVVLGLLLWDAFDQLLRLPYLDLGAAAVVVGQTLVRLLRWGGVVFIVVGIVDFAWQRFHFMQNQRMTDRELRDEQRDDNGDPEVAQARKRRHQELVREGSLTQTTKASFVVRNPTHIACAVLYAPEEDALPHVIAKGADLMALRMVDIASEYGVEMIEDIPLARALYRVPVGRPVPSELIAAVQAVLEQLQERMLLRGECPPWLEHMLSRQERDDLERTLEEIRATSRAEAINEAATAPTT